MRRFFYIFCSVLCLSTQANGQTESGKLNLQNQNLNQIERVYKGLSNGLIAAQAQVKTKIQLVSLFPVASSSNNNQIGSDPSASGVIGTIRNAYSAYARSGIESELPELQTLRQKLSRTFSFKTQKSAARKKAKQERAARKAKWVSPAPPLSLGQISSWHKFKKASKKLGKKAFDWELKVDPSALLVGGGFEGRLKHGSGRFVSTLEQDGSHTHRVYPYSNKNISLVVENHNSDAEHWVVHARAINPTWKKTQLHNYIDTRSKVVGTNLVYQNSQKTRIQLQATVGLDSGSQSLGLQFFHSI